MKTLKHRSMKALAIILSVILVLMSLPLSVFADGLQNLFEKPEVPPIRTDGKDRGVHITILIN